MTDPAPSIPLEDSASWKPRFPNESVGWSGFALLILFCLVAAWKQSRGYETVGTQLVFDGVVMVLAAVLAIAAGAKFADPAAGVPAVRHFLRDTLHRKIGASQASALVVGLALLEVLLAGVLVVAGGALFGIAAVTTAGLGASFVWFSTAARRAGLPCGCFGRSAHAASRRTQLRSSAFTAFAVLAVAGFAAGYSGFTGGLRAAGLTASATAGAYAIVRAGTRPEPAQVASSAEREMSRRSLLRGLTILAGTAGIAPALVPMDFGRLGLGRPVADRATDSALLDLALRDSTLQRLMSDLAERGHQIDVTSAVTSGHMRGVRALVTFRTSGPGTVLWINDLPADSDVFSYPRPTVNAAVSLIREPGARFIVATSRVERGATETVALPDTPASAPSANAALCQEGAAYAQCEGDKVSCESDCKHDLSFCILGCMFAANCDGERLDRCGREEAECLDGCDDAYDCKLCGSGCC